MIWSGPTIIGMLVLSLIAICAWWLAHLAPEQTIQHRERRVVSGRTRVDIPGDDIIGSDSDPLGWTALDELQLHRLLSGPPQ